MEHVLGVFHLLERKLSTQQRRAAVSHLLYVATFTNSPGELLGLCIHNVSTDSPGETFQSISRSTDSALRVASCTSVL